VKRTSTPTRRALVAGLIATLLVTTVAIGPDPAGAAAQPVLWTDVMKVELGPTTLGSTSPSETVTFRNAGPGSAVGLELAVVGSSEIQIASTTCRGALDPGTSCTAQVRFVARSGMVASAGLVLSASGGLRRRVTLVGRPDAPASPLAVTATGHDFGPVAVGATTGARLIVITNISALPTTVTATAPAPTFAFLAGSSSCSGVLPAGATCTIGYRFRPPAAGPHELRGGLTVTGSTGGSRTYPVVLRGHGGTTGAPILTVSPTGFDFGRVIVGARSQPQTVTVTNTSATTQPIIGPGINGVTYALIGCNGSLAPGASCQIDITSAPREIGLHVHHLDLQLSFRDGRVHRVPFDLSTTAVGSVPRLRFTPAALDLGPLPVGATPATRTVVVTNTGAGPAQGLTVGSLPGPASLVVTGTSCGSILAAGASCTINVRYTPTSTARVVRNVEVRAIGLAPSHIAMWGGRRPGVEEAWIRYLLLAYFERQPVGVEASGPAAVIEQGIATRLDVATAIFTGEEHVGQVVQGLYQSTLGRPGDEAGVRFWVDQIRQRRRTLAQVVASFYGSAEYFAGIGGGTTRTWVADVYRKLLQRPADAAGVDYWVGQVAAQGRTRVALRFYDTPESRRTRVLGASFTLGRNPTETEISAWRTRLGQIGDLALTAEIASSAEVVLVAQQLDL